MNTSLMTEFVLPETDLEKISKGWSIAMTYSRNRLMRVYELEGAELDAAVDDGRLVLETLCCFVHACVRHGQYQLPLEFWKMLHTEYGIIVYPSALMDDVVGDGGVAEDSTFTECYRGHIVMFGRYSKAYPPPDPFEFLQEPPPAYMK